MSDRTIWRVRLDLTEHQQVQLPPGSRILTVQRREGESGDHLDLWAEVTPCEPRRVMFYLVRLVGTGGGAPTGSDMRYVSTVQLDGGRLVFHVYVTAVQPGEVAA